MIVVGSVKQICSWDLVWGTTVVTKQQHEEESVNFAYASTFTVHHCKKLGKEHK